MLIVVVVSLPHLFDCYAMIFGSHSFSPSAVVGTEILAKSYFNIALGKTQTRQPDKVMLFRFKR